nr:MULTISPECIES: FeoA family protein [unclassified Ruminococcus]
MILDKEVRLLSSLKKGEKCTVKELRMDGRERRRMLDLGLINDTQVEAVLVSPAGGLTAYYIRGALLAIRNEDASKVVVSIK